MVAIFFSRGSSRPRDRTPVSCISCLAGGFFTAEPPGKTFVPSSFSVFYCSRRKHLSRRKHCSKRSQVPACLKATLVKVGPRFLAGVPDFCPLQIPDPSPLATHQIRVPGESLGIFILLKSSAESPIHKTRVPGTLRTGFKCALLRPSPYFTGEALETRGMEPELQRSALFHLHMARSVPGSQEPVSAAHRELPSTFQIPASN